MPRAIDKRAKLQFRETVSGKLRNSDLDVFQFTLNHDTGRSAVTGDSRCCFMDSAGARLLTWLGAFLHNDNVFVIIEAARKPSDGGGMYRYVHVERTRQPHGLAACTVVPRAALADAPAFLSAFSASIEPLRPADLKWNEADLSEGASP